MPSSGVFTMYKEEADVQRGGRRSGGRPQWGPETKAH